MKNIHITQVKGNDTCVAYEDGTFDLFKGIKMLYHPPLVWHIPCYLALVEDEDTFQVWILTNNQEAVSELKRYLIASNQTWISKILIVQSIQHINDI